MNFKFPLFWAERAEEPSIPTAAAVLSKGFALCEVESNSRGDQVTGVPEGAGLAEGWVQHGCPHAAGERAQKVPYCKHHVSGECSRGTHTKGTVTKHASLQAALAPL